MQAETTAAGSAAKAYKGIAMEGPIASWYARTTRKDVKRHREMARQIAPGLRPGSRVLEIAPGPGYFCIELARLGSYQVTGLDISSSFVEIARRSAAEAGIAATFVRGNASALPFADGSFDLCFCQAAFKNFSDPVGAIREMHRVLAPGGVAIIVDMRKDATPQEMEREVQGMDLGPINRWFVRWTFRQMLVKSAYTVDELASMIAQTPFGTGSIQREGIGFRARLAKPARA